jgi:hypothetical protein
MFEALLAQYERALPPTRERFLRSAYWHDRTRETWDVSASLCCVAAANAIEVVVPAVGEDRCPTCGLNRAPGPTRRFVQFVEQYALDIDAAARQDLYRLRSSLVHGDVLLDLDVPGPWGALVPRDFEQRDIIGTTLRAGRLGAINWLINAEVA